MTLIFIISSVQTVQAESVGFTQITMNDDLNRPLSVFIWYPTKQKNPMSKLAENVVFVGTDVVKNAEPKDTTSPLIVMSHGYRGSWRNLNWLAHKFAQQGYVVAAPDHPGTTTLDQSQESATQWWQRPRDLSRVLTYMLETSAWQGQLDASDVTAIGHSLGGWSVMQLAGAEFDRETFKIQCEIFPNPRVCGLSDGLGLSNKQPNEPERNRFVDDRVKKVVSLDLGMARSFSPMSLSKIKAPVLILAAGIDIGDLPQAQESGYLAEHIPLQIRRYKVYEQAAHFSFMQLCKTGAVALLNQEVPGDGIVCLDGKGAKRERLHNQIFRDVVGFVDAKM
ncbi:alpha/beta fold hydrolase [Enterovibrio sp. ZSDZ35]|uniref:Alpha/beta fold hydrolase n=1 Tax=Enterovibrio qingdaonensis TaxID=2899818 RepID=A0ABT5QG90_9GAMM|nr:alpha/beta fold hydrolase [Enterovibrio sp. ZSDZ35]MDD1779995.1 alpha/beta fold hydrolase [Enterovibrio sp. ZSDZ35]